MPVSENCNDTKFISSSSDAENNKTQKWAGSRPLLTQPNLGKVGSLGLKLYASAVPSRQACADGPPRRSVILHRCLYFSSADALTNVK